MRHLCVIVLNAFLGSMPVESRMPRGSLRCGACYNSTKVATIRRLDGAWPHLDPSGSTRTKGIRIAARLSAMRTLVVIAIMAAVACSSDRSRTESVQMSEDDGLRAALDLLVSYQAATNTHHYDEPIRQIRLLLCPKGPCDGNPSARWDPRDIGALALLYAHSTTPEVRAIAVAIACGVCSEANAVCRCEGRSCTANDVAPRHSHRKTTLRCNATEVNGTAYTWGRAVKEIP